MGVADLIDPVAGVIGEYNGGEHRGVRRQHRDAEKEDLARRVGLEFFQVTSLDMADHRRVVERMRSTRARARFESPSTRAWTLGPPGHWLRPANRVSPVTLDERLAEREWTAARLARVAALEETGLHAAG